MDVAEASKHGKKSTSQKLEDQKKVGHIFVFYFISFLLLHVWLQQVLLCGFLLALFSHAF